MIELRVGDSRAFFRSAVSRLKDAGYESLGVTWISDVNAASLRQMERLGARPLQRLHLFRKGLRGKSNSGHRACLRQNNPTGKIPLPPSGKSVVLIGPSHPIRGACARHERCGGMRWTRVRAEDERLNARTAKACGPDPPMPGSTPGQKPGGRWQRSPAHRGERAISRKPLRRGCRLFRLPCRCLRAQSALSFARKARGCGQHPAFPAPSALPRARHDAKLGHVVPREGGRASSSLFDM